MAASIEAAMLE